MVDARASQAGLYGLAAVVPETRASQAGIYALISTGVTTRASQAGLYALVAVTAEVRTSQAGIYVLASGSPCGTRWAQIWTITRTDGEVFRFTSLDRDLVWGGQTYESCNSLVPSASENANDVGSVGNMELAGIVALSAVSAADLEAGRFDGAHVEAWVVPWSGTEVPKAILRGTFGKVEHGSRGFKVELVGDGGRLLQTPLVRTIEPGCKWIFGDSRCGKDLGPLTVTGTVDVGEGQRGFTDAARAETAGYFDYGRVTFTSGLNNGLTAEIKEHGAGGVFTLWPRLASPIAVGDTYSMTPGCTNLKTAVGGTNGCTAWDRIVAYGGFDTMPGADALGETPTPKE